MGGWEEEEKGRLVGAVGGRKEGGAKKGPSNKATVGAYIPGKN